MKLCGTRKTVLSLLLALTLFASASLPAYADEADVAKGDSSMEITPEYAEEVRQMRGDGILDPEELDRRVEAFITEHNLKKENISFGYCYLETGDEYYYNGDTSIGEICNRTGKSTYESRPNNSTSCDMWMMCIFGSSSSKDI